MILLHDQSFEAFYQFLVEDAAEAAEAEETASPNLLKAAQGPRLLFFFVKVELFRDERDTNAKNRMAKQLLVFLNQLCQDDYALEEKNQRAERLLDKATGDYIQRALTNSSPQNPVSANLFDTVQVLHEKKVT